jgi:serine/threonine-protein kinase
VAGAAAVVALVGLAALLVWLRPGTPSAPAPAPVTPVAVTQPAQPAPAAPSSTPPSEAPVERATVAPPPVASTAAAPTVTPPRKTEQARPPERQAPAEVLPEAARKDLELAEQALASGDVAEAIRLGRRSQRVVLSGASYALLTRAHCRDQDLSNARAQWAHVPASERSRVRQYCKLYEIPL